MSANTSKLALLLLTTHLCQSSVRAQVRALDYETPALVEAEFDEIVVREDQPAAVITLHRAGDFRKITRISYTTEEGTASEGKDYKGTGGTVTFQPGEGMKQIEVALIRDRDSEPEENFRVVLSDPGPNTIITMTSILVRIQDVAPTADIPKLQIAAAGRGKVSLSWEGPTYSLERTTDAASNEWEAVPGAPNVSGNRCEVVEETGGGLYLYRLRGE